MSQYEAHQRGDIPMTVDQFVSTSRRFQEIVNHLAECLLLGQEIRLHQLRSAYWMMFAITHWGRRLIDATRWQEKLEFSVWEIPNSKLIGATAHEAVFPLAAVLDPGGPMVDISTNPNDWRIDELRHLIAKLNQECVILTESAVAEPDGMAMKALCLTLDISDTQLRKYTTKASVPCGSRGKARKFSAIEVRAICETILDDQSSTLATKQSAQKLLQRIIA